MAASGGFAVTPNDGVTFKPTLGVFVGGAGSLAVMVDGGPDVTFAAVPANTHLPIRVTKIKSSGTTATNIVALV